MKRILTLATVALGLALGSVPLQAQTANPDKWGPNDLRRVLANWLEQHGTPVPEINAIGPLDPRMQITPCDAPEISVRSSASTSYVLRCKSPENWQYVLRLDGDTRAVTATNPRPPGSFGTIVVPKGMIPTGTVLKADMLEERPASGSAPPQAFRSVEDAVGMRAATNVQPGLPLTMRHVVKTPAVLKGETVMVMAGGAGFQIALPGRAEQDGYEGDVISVRNLNSGKIVTGRLEAGKTVHIRQF
jgi:flagella basal body P-ring formation protein FlgA